MGSIVKACLLSRKGFGASKPRCDETIDETKWLLLSGSNAELLDEQSQIGFTPIRRSSSMRESGFPHVNRTSDKNFNCNIGSGNYSEIVAQVSRQVRPCLPSPTLMRRRNAICDEIEKTTMDLPGRTLRQRRVDLLRGIALAQFSLL